MWHSICLTPRPFLRGPWFCRHCRTELSALGTCDLTVDVDLIRYLNGDRTLPEPTLARCMRAARYIWLADDGVLHVKGRHYTDLVVPPMHERLSIV